jgi:hypothetical protein
MEALQKYGARRLTTQQMQTDLEVAQKQRKESEEKLAAAMQELAQVKQELAQVKQELAQVKLDLEAARSETQSLVAGKESLMASSKAEIHGLNEELGKTERRAAELKAKLRRCEEHRKQLQGEQTNALSDKDGDIERLQDRAKQLERKLVEAEEAHKGCEAHHDKLRRELAHHKKLHREREIAEEFRRSTGIEGLPSTDPTTNPLQATVDDLRRQLNECKEHRQKLQDEKPKDLGTLVAEGDMLDNNPEIKRLQDRVNELETKLTACLKHRRSLEGNDEGEAPGISGTGRPGLRPGIPKTPGNEGAGDGEDDLPHTSDMSRGASDSLETRRPASSIPVNLPGTEQGTPTKTTSHPLAHGRGISAIPAGNAPSDPHQETEETPPAVRPESSVPQGNTENTDKITGGSAASNAAMPASEPRKPGRTARRRGGAPTPHDGDETLPPENRGRSSNWLLWLLVIFAMLGIAALVWDGWCSSQLLRTGYGYYYHGGFNGYQLDVSFVWWQFCCFSVLLGFIAVVMVYKACGGCIFQGFVGALAAALIDELEARQGPRLG